jgi:four helix bundle protein
VGSRGFWDLDVYQRSVALAVELRRVIHTWDNFDRWSVGIQMARSAYSVGANVSEAFGRDQHRDQRRFLFIARGSACETQHWIDIAERAELSLPSHAASEASQMARMLNGLIRSLG